MEIVRGQTTKATLPRDIRRLFDRFYAGFKGKGGLNVVFYPGWSENGEFEIGCGVLVESGGNAATPAGLVATTSYFGPYEKMHSAHQTIHEWARQNGRKLGASWEVYGHWNDDPAKRRTDIYYLVGA
ncbi:MAG: hypothetical protein JO041_14765 [Acidobacteria bacterium]|nr:hypothetical protein [Acidobacteriota bacterium]